MREHVFAMAGVAIVAFSDLVDSTVLLARLGDDRSRHITGAERQGRGIQTFGHIS
jgi:hypothetical protein